MKRILYALHRWLGVLLSGLFLVWFLSGIVMIYHGYPRMTDAEVLQHSPSLDINKLPSPDSLARLMFRHGVDTTRFYNLQLETNLQGETFFTASASSGKKRIRIQGDTLVIPVIDKTFLNNLASRWQTSVQRVDTLTELDQWTPFSRLKEDLPFYRVRLADGEDRWLYVSSVSGRVLSESTSFERFWAYLGAVPHWIYPTILRQDADLWINVVVTLSALGSVMVLIGLYMGVERYLSSRKQRNKYIWQSPYKKVSYKWHHVLGTISGFFVFAWVFSGMMSLVDVPEWVSGVPKDKPRILLEGTVVAQHRWTTDYRRILHAVPKAKRITWTSFDSRPLLRIETQDNTVVWDMTDCRPLSLTKGQIVHAIEKACNDTLQHIELLQEYDEYYIDRRQKLPLPVYKATLGDAYATVLYVDPATGNTRVIDQGSRLSMWMYKKPHTLAFPVLVKYPALWTLVMWTLLLMGVGVSFTGIWLGIKCLRRKFRG